MKEHNKIDRLKTTVCSFFVRRMSSVFIILLLLPAIPLMAVDLERALAGIPAKAMEELKSYGETFRYDKDQHGALLLPRNPMTHRIRAITASLNPDVFVEGLYIIPYPEGKDAIDLDIYNITRKVSDIAGVGYLSARKKKVVPIFDNVYAISDVKTRHRIEDPLVDVIPASDTVFVHMKETSLGRALYQIDYLHDKENMGFFLKNLSVLRAFFKVIDRENMQISMIFMPTEVGFLVYGSCSVLLSNADLVFNFIDPYSGFYRRLYAMITWVYNAMHGIHRYPDFGEPLNF